MKSVLEVQIQKLFIVTIFLKITSSFFGWYLQDPWILGFTVPLVVMTIYIAVGYFRRDKSVSDEKFADSCYYLGFIFTITSIIFSLFDLPQIGTKIADIAIRFGAAMVSTVFGLIVRVAMVSFKKDADDAIRDVEDSLVDASIKFREQLVMAFEKLREFQTNVDVATKETVERINIQVETLSKNHADKLSEFFENLSDRNEKVFSASVNEVKSASVRLSGAFENYANSMRASVLSIEKRVEAFSDAVTERLESTTFPDDYFSQHLEEPLQHLTASSKEIAKGVNVAATQVSESSALLSATLKKLRTKTKASEDALDKVISLSAQQERILEAAQGQVTTLDAVASTLSKIDVAVAESTAALKASQSMNEQLLAQLAEAESNRANIRDSVNSALSTVVEQVKASTEATSVMAGKLASSTAVTLKLLGKLDASGTDIKPFSAYGPLDKGSIGSDPQHTSAPQAPVSINRVEPVVPEGTPQGERASTATATAGDAAHSPAWSQNSRESKI